MVSIQKLGDIRIRVNFHDARKHSKYELHLHNYKISRLRDIPLFKICVLVIKSLSPSGWGLFSKFAHNLIDVVACLVQLSTQKCVLTEEFWIEIGISYLWGWSTGLLTLETHNRSLTTLWLVSFCESNLQFFGCRVHFSLQGYSFFCGLLW